MTVVSSSLRTAREFLDLVDHSILKPWLPPEEVAAGLDFARRTRPKAVCVLPTAVRRAAEALDGSGVLIGAVNGFPSGDHPTEVKALECRLTDRDGAVEIDTVIDIAALKRGDLRRVIDDLRAVVEATDHCVKAIVESPVLSDDELRLACEAVVEAGAGFIKTGTGFNGAATPAQVRLMRACVGPDLPLKAAGGIRTLADARAMVDAGATRLGVSGTQAMLAEFDAESRDEL